MERLKKLKIYILDLQNRGLQREFNEEDYDLTEFDSLEKLEILSLSEG